MKAWLIPSMIAERVGLMDDVFGNREGQSSYLEEFDFEALEPVEVEPCLLTETDGIYRVTQGKHWALLPLNCLVLIV